MDGHLPEEVRRARRDQLLEAQQAVAFSWSKAQVGRRLEVILDAPVPGQAKAFVGRTYADAPEVDGAAYVSGAGLAAGQIVSCDVVSAKGYDLVCVAGGENDNT